MKVEVVYAEQDRQVLRQISLTEGATVADALDQVTGDPEFVGLVLKDHSVGIFGRLCEPTQVLADGDRVEVYRELDVDAKEARRQRALSQKKLR